ncbi:MAG: 3-hydroxybutyrate dehydrogenase [Hyphomicrobiales bacterium]
MLKDKVALITGSTGGIGQLTAGVLAREGCRIMLNGFGDPRSIERDRAGLQESSGVEIRYMPADMRNPEEVCNLVKETHNAFGRIDILVNNVGIQHVAPLDEFPPDIWDSMLAINLSAMFHTIRTAIPFMRERKWGRIINMASSHGLVASPHKVPYIATKHGVVGLTKGTALECAPWGITCNAVAPGIVNTPLGRSQAEGVARVEGITADEVLDRLLTQKHAIQRMVEPSEIAAVISFLCSDNAAMITGTALPVDGGWTTH